MISVFRATLLSAEPGNGVCAAIIQEIAVVLPATFRIDSWTVRVKYICIQGLTVTASQSSSLGRTIGSIVWYPPWQDISSAHAIVTIYSNLLSTFADSRVTNFNCLVTRHSLCAVTWYFTGTVLAIHIWYISSMLKGITCSGSPHDVLCSPYSILQPTQSMPLCTAILWNPVKLHKLT